MTSSDLRAWRESTPVEEFLVSAASVPGELLRFDDVEPSTLRELVAAGPTELLEQSSGEGPTLAVLIERAAALRATLGGYASSLGRSDTAFFCDTLTLPPGVDPQSISDLEPHDQTATDAGGTRVWWD